MSFMLMAAAASSRITTVIGQAQWVTPGTYTWTCPPNVYEVSAVAIGAGSKGGGGLGWKNKIPVTPGQTYTVRVGMALGTDGTGDSYFISLTTVAGKCADTGGTFVGDGGGNGGSVGIGSQGFGGGGAGGYQGNGGAGANARVSGTTGSFNGFSGAAGSGGGAGGGGGGYYIEESSGAYAHAWYPGGGGGGVSIYGLGTSGSGGGGGTGTGTSGKGGGGGSSGAAGTAGPNIGSVSVRYGGDGGLYGGGAGSGYYESNRDSNTGQRFTLYNVASGNPQSGAVRLIWGVGRAFPATRTANE